MMEPLVNYKLITNRVSVKNNYLNDGSFSVDPKVNRRIDRIDDTHSAVTYDLEIRSTEKKPFPVDIEVSLTGVFDTSKLEKRQIDDFLKIQTCQIIFPQIRTIVASLTSASLMPPLLLPIVDVRQLFGENHKNETQ